MYLSKFSKFVLVLLAAFLTYSCAKEFSCEDCVEKNQPPFSNAGPDLSISLPADSILLDGSESSDADDGIVKYEWEKIFGQDPIQLSSPQGMRTSVRGLQKGIYRFQLKVTDKGGLYTMDTVSVDVSEILRDTVTRGMRPLAQAGPDITIQVDPTNCSFQNNLGGYNATLDGSRSSDTDGTITSYLWTLVAGAECFIKDRNAAVTEVGIRVSGKFVFELQVKDDLGNITRDSVAITAVVLQTSVSREGNSSIITKDLPGAWVWEKAVVGNKIFMMEANPFSGGINNPQIRIYDVSTGQKSSYDPPTGFIASHAVATKGKAYFIGKDEMLVFDSPSGLWTSIEKNRKGVTPQLVSVIANKVVLIGDASAEDRRVDIYDEVTNQWQSPHTTEKAGVSSVTVMGDRLYLVGTLISQLPSPILDVYDSRTNTWGTDKISIPRAGASAGVNGRILVVTGGYTKDISQISQECRQIEFYNVDTRVSVTSCMQLECSETMNIFTVNNKIVFQIPEQHLFDVYNIQNKERLLYTFPVVEEGYQPVLINGQLFLVSGSQLHQVTF
jgi:hypothetical protein